MFSQVEREASSRAIGPRYPASRAASARSRASLRRPATAPPETMRTPSASRAARPRAILRRLIRPARGPASACPRTSTAWPRGVAGLWSVGRTRPPSIAWSRGAVKGGLVAEAGFTGGTWLRGAGSRLGTRSQPIHPGARVRPARASEPGGSARRSGRNHRAARRSISPAPSEAARPAPAASPAATTNPFTSPSQHHHNIACAHHDPHNNPDRDIESGSPIEVRSLSAPQSNTKYVEQKEQKQPQLQGHIGEHTKTHTSSSDTIGCT